MGVRCNFAEKSSIDLPMNKTVSYEQSFKAFVRKTSEKREILSLLTKEISLGKKVHFLDIGGGNGALTLPLSKKVGRTLVVEPNPSFAQHFSLKGIPCINERWETARIREKFDFVLAAYVVTHFPKTKIRGLVGKMMNCLRPNGKLVMIAVDEKAGSWRQIHTYFYKLIGLQRKSSTQELKKIAKTLRAKKIKITTAVRANNEEKMLRVLSFDFGKYGNKFEQHKEKLKSYLRRKRDNNGIMLNIMHWIFIVAKNQLSPKDGKKY